MKHINIMLSLDVVEALHVTGAEWQTRIDAALWEWLQTHNVQATLAHLLPAGQSAIANTLTILGCYAPLRQI